MISYLVRVMVMVRVRVRVRVRVKVRVKVREVDLVLGEAELAQDLLGQVEHARDLIGELLGQAEDVRVVLREAAHAEEALQRARALVAVHGAQLAPAEREVLVRLRLVLIPVPVWGPLG